MNPTLMRELGWESDKYFAIRNRLIDRGEAIKGRGRGGSTSLISSEETSIEVEDNEAKNSTPAPARITEDSLYEPCLKIIENNWTDDEGFDRHLSYNTARQGRRSTGGKWSRPDLAVLALKAYPYLPGKTFEIITFEVKPPDDVTVEGVFEALAHQQMATRAYVLFYDPDLKQEDSESFRPAFQEKHDKQARIITTAQKHGVGVILVTDLEDYSFWEELSPAARVAPDPEQANSFIGQSFPDSISDEVLKWHK